MDSDFIDEIAGLTRSIECVSILCNGEVLISVAGLDLRWKVDGSVPGVECDRDVTWLCCWRVIMMARLKAMVEPMLRSLSRSMG